ncbi:MAG: hypothetical protein H7Y08_00015 [Rhizobiaceae bacterium]|nr:hypothetical protein [Rhizobiaceae bacterium]
MSGHPIPSHPHLPAAVDYADQDALLPLSDAELLRLMEHCALWSAAMEEFHASLHTPAAVTIWNVLLRAEVDLVRCAGARLEGEIERRSDRRQERATLDCHVPAADKRPRTARLSPPASRRSA